MDEEQVEEISIVKREPATVIAVHTDLVSELRIRKEVMEKETGRKSRGGLTTFSQMAAYELKLMRLSGDQLMKEISKIKKPLIETINVNGTERQYVPYEYFKKIYILSSALNKRKDQKQIHIEVAKIRGTQKNEVKFSY